MRPFHHEAKTLWTHYCCVAILFIAAFHEPFLMTRAACGGFAALQIAPSQREP